MTDGQKAFEADIRSVPHSEISKSHNKQCPHVQYEKTVLKHANDSTAHCSLGLLAVGLYTTLAVMTNKAKSLQFLTLAVCQLAEEKFLVSCEFPFLLNNHISGLYNPVLMFVEECQYL